MKNHSFARLTHALPQIRLHHPRRDTIHSERSEIECQLSRQPVDSSTNKRKHAPASCDGLVADRSTRENDAAARGLVEVFDGMLRDEDGRNGADLTALLPFLERDFGEWQHGQAIACHVYDVIDCADMFEKSDYVVFNIWRGEVAGKASYMGLHASELGLERGDARVKLLSAGGGENNGCIVNEQEASNCKADATGPADEENALAREL